MWRRILKLLWALPCTLVGLVLLVMLLLVGGRASLVEGTLEAVFRKRLSHCGRLLKALPYRGITFGHVIIAITEEELDHLRAHEHAHVRQYERWGVFFFPAYLASSLWQWLRGRRAYWDNWFEVEARRESE